MEAVFLWIGKTFCVVGGIAIALFLLLLLFELALEAWRLFSNRFRDVCKAESLIFEYRKHQKEFQKWLNDKDNGD